MASAKRIASICSHPMCLAFLFTPFSARTLPFAWLVNANQEERRYPTTERVFNAGLQGN